MSNPGHVYVLINPSMAGMVKIGKTTKDPNERAKELSTTTGVPTPFILVFDAYFENCSRAEEYVMTRLEQKNYRVSDNREFFAAPVNEAVNAILEAQNIIGMGQSLPADEDDLENDEKNLANDPFSLSDTATPWGDLFGLAEAAYYGLGDTLQDNAEALRLSKQAAKLGSPEACMIVGKIYNELGDKQQSLAYFKDGASRGIAECYLEMAEIFAKNKQFDNFRKCWSKYFESESFLSNADDQGEHAYSYLFEVHLNRLPIEHQDLLFQIRDEIYRAAERSLDISRARQNGAEHVFEADLLFFRRILYPEVPRNVARGQIKWFDEAKGYGFIRQEHGADAYLHECNIIGEFASLQEGQRVEFEMAGEKDRPIACNVRLL